MHLVDRVDWSFADAPAAASATSRGLARKVLVGTANGATHTELAAGALQAGGWLARHVHSFEEALYVLDGELLLEIDQHVHRLVAGDYAVIPIATHHTLANTSATGAAGSARTRRPAVRRTPPSVTRCSPPRRRTWRPSTRPPSRSPRRTRRGGSSATTRVLRPSSRRSASTTIPGAAGPPAWTPRCSRTAGYP